MAVQKWTFKTLKSDMMSTLTVKESDALKVGELLNNPGRPLAERFRALFTLRNVRGSSAVSEITMCLVSSETSALLKHECAYCLGQMQDEQSLPVLKQVLSDTKQDSMVRHEAGEAMAAIGKPISSLRSWLVEYINDEHKEVAETCQIAVDKLDWLANNSDFVDNNPYASIDPAPPTGRGKISEWASDLNNPQLSLFTRYRALFALRNTGGIEAVKAITSGLADESVLFKHEIAYVLGQMQDPLAVDALHNKLQDLAEHPMVRHECAEALGSIASPLCLEILKQFSQDEVQVVRESCVVALDMYLYEHSDELQYANTLNTVCNNV